MEKIIPPRFQFLRMVNTNVNTMICLAQDLESEVPAGSAGTLEVNPPRREVVLKTVINPRRKAQMKALEVEYQIQATHSHKNILKMLEKIFVDHEEGLPAPCLVMEFAPGGDLFKAMQQDLDIQTHKGIKKILYEVGLAVEHLHQQGVIHRDIKPENIFLDQDKVAKLADFGWACLESDRKATVERAGTLQYMSPESLKGWIQDRGADIWSLGILLYEMYHNREPFPGKTVPELLNSIFNKSVEFDSKISDANLVDLFSQCVKFSPHERISISKFLDHPFFDTIRPEVDRPAPTREYISKTLRAYKDKGRGCSVDSKRVPLSNIEPLDNLISSFPEAKRPLFRPSIPREQTNKELGTNFLSSFNSQNQGSLFQMPSNLSKTYAFKAEKKHEVDIPSEKESTELSRGLMNGFSSSAKARSYSSHCRPTPNSIQKELNIKPFSNVLSQPQFLAHIRGKVSARAGASRISNNPLVSPAENQNSFFSIGSINRTQTRLKRNMEEDSASTCDGYVPPARKPWQMEKSTPPRPKVKGTSGINIDGLLSTYNPLGHLLPKSISSTEKPSSKMLSNFSKRPVPESKPFSPVFSENFSMASPGNSRMKYLAQLSKPITEPFKNSSGASPSHFQNLRPAQPLNLKLLGAFSNEGANSSPLYR